MPKRGPTARTVPVLLYHDVSDGPVHDGFRRYVVPPGLFEEHLSALASAGHRTANASTLVPDDGAPVRRERPPIHLTFDDGYRSFADAVMPMMERYGMTGTVFVPTAFVGGRAEWLSDLDEEHRELMTWSDIGDVVAAGAEVGAHGHRHLPFDTVPSRQLLSELADGRDLLEDRLGTSVTSLAYPFGFHDRSVRKYTRNCGYRIAFEVGDDIQRWPLDPLPGADEVFRVRRIVVGPETSGDDLLELIEGGRRSRTVQRARRMARPGWRLARRLSAVGRRP